MSHRVIIELEFAERNVNNDKKVVNADVYDYLEDMIEDESLDYTVVNQATGETYGVIDYKGLPNEERDRYV